MKKEKNEFEEFKNELESVLIPSGINNENTIDDLTYILSYLCLIDSKLENGPFNFYDEKLIPKSEDTFGNLIDTIRARLDNLNYNPYKEYTDEALEYLEDYRYCDIDTRRLVYILKKRDIYFYEKILTDNVVNQNFSKSQSGYVSTPNELIKLFEYFAPGNKYLDIGCGNGNTLIGLSYIKKGKLECDGIEINPRNVFISNMRLSLRDNVESVIMLNDYLTSNLEKKYSYITINMPFNLHIPTIKRNEIKYVSKNEKFDWIFTPATSSEWIYINKALNLLDNEGRIVLVTSQLPLYKTGDQKFREDIVNNNLIEYVIDMPTGTYYSQKDPYSVVILNNNKQDNIIKFVNGAECCTSQKFDKKLDVDKLINILENKEYKEVLNETVAENEYNLLPSKYLNLNMKSQLKNATKLCDLKAEITRGYQAFSRSDAVTNGKYSIVTITDIDDNGNISNNLGRFNTTKDIDKYILRKDDILISTKGTKIKICLIDKLENENTVYQGNLTLIRLKDDRVDPTYLKIYFESERGQLELKSIQTGTAIISINTTQLSKIEIPLIPIEEQRKLVKDYNLKKLEIDALTNRLKELKDGIYDSINSAFEGER